MDKIIKKGSGTINHLPFRLKKPSTAWLSLMMKYKAAFELFQKLHVLIYESQLVTS